MEGGDCGANSVCRKWAEGLEVVVKIDDDGVGFSGEAERPWTIASRVDELGGRLRVRNAGSPGAHLEVRLQSAPTISPGYPRRKEQRAPRALDAAAWRVQ